MSGCAEARPSVGGPVPTAGRDGRVSAETLLQQKIALEEVMRNNATLLLHGRETEKLIYARKSSGSFVTLNIGRSTKSKSQTRSVTAQHNEIEVRRTLRDLEKAG